ncbi:unannotated protein [freshwater metagenome]|uniref:Unannotated protein n=1 Tax=freshwater metagenome TaxID=449393 RepID=A0A6J6P0R9_9ZZZZ
MGMVSACATDGMAPSDRVSAAMVVTAMRGVIRMPPSIDVARTGIGVERCPFVLAQRPTLE